MRTTKNSKASRKFAKEAAPKASRKTRRGRKPQETSEKAGKAPEALPAQEKAQDEAAAKAHSQPRKSKALPVMVKDGTASVQTMVSEAVGAHFRVETALAPKQGFILDLNVGEEEAVKLVARYVKPLKDGTLVMAFLPKRKAGIQSQAPVLAKHKGEPCRISWDVDQVADDLESTILDFLGAAKEPVPLDTIIEKTEREPAKVLAALMVLEVRKLVKQMPGKRFLLA